MNDAPAQGQDSPLGNAVVGTSPQTPGTDQPTGQPVDQPQTPQEPVGQPASPVGGPLGQKEQEPVAAEATVSPEDVEVREIEEPEAVPEEVQGWVERVGRGEQVHLAQPIVHQGEILVESANPKNVKVVLPLTEEATKLGLHRKVVESVRWLAEWCFRLFKKLPGKVLYQQPKGIT